MPQSWVRDVRGWSEVQQTGQKCQRKRSLGRPGFSDKLGLAFGANLALHFFDIGICDGLLSAEDPDTLFLVHTGVATQGAQGDFFAGRFQLQGIASGEAQFVAKWFWKND